MRSTLPKRQNMVLADDIMHGRGLSNKMHSQLQPKKTKIMLSYTRCI